MTELCNGTLHDIVMKRSVLLYGTEIVGILRQIGDGLGHLHDVQGARSPRLEATEHTMHMHIHTSLNEH